MSNIAQLPFCPTLDRPYFRFVAVVMLGRYFDSRHSQCARSAFTTSRMIVRTPPLHTLLRHCLLSRLCLGAGRSPPRLPLVDKLGLSFCAAPEAIHSPCVASKSLFGVLSFSRAREVSTKGGALTAYCFAQIR